MSSFIGHSVMAITVYLATEQLVFTTATTKPCKSLSRIEQWLWLSWLVVIASIPDLDYIIESWHSSNNSGLRITHSVLFSLIFPCLTVTALLLLNSRKIWQRSFQVILAGLSHLVLDLLVGVTPLPLWFPLLKIPIKLPFGILPSAGRIDPDNYYFYRNLGLEMGVLLPVLITVSLLGFKGNRIFLGQNSFWGKLIKLLLLVVMMLCMVYFIKQNLQLPR